MISVQEADKIIAGSLRLFPETLCTISAAQGKILREDICADRDSPPFNRVAMDGIAINFSAWLAGLKKFRIEGIQKAGDQPLVLHNKENCLEVMTGAVLPAGTDCVIKIEDLRIENGYALLENNPELQLRQNIHQLGTDHKKGSILLNKGQKLLAPQIAVAASVGKSELFVSDLPSIALVATGDELVDVGQEVKDWQIRMSNSYALQAALKGMGIEKVEIFHITDDKKLLQEKLAGLIDNFDLLILSGGVSMGKFDYIPEVLKDLKVDKAFHKISQKPGKPFWFGLSEAGKPVFALPGNPVSTLICFRRYVVPYLNRSLCFQGFETIYAVLAEEVNFKPAMTYFLPVKIKNEQGTLKSYPVRFNGSGDYASLVNSDGFIELPAETAKFPAGYIAPLFLWDF